MAISTKSAQVLQKSGWWPGRAIDCGELIERIESRGFTVADHAVSILVQLAGITVRGGRRCRTLEFGDWGGARDEVEPWERQLETSMTPIALLDELYDVLVGVNEKVYLCGGDWLKVWNGGMYEFLEDVLVGEGGPTDVAMDVRYWEE
jgi:hypothetical protein